MRELSPNEAADALMARLSYSASIRAEVATRRCAEKLTVFETVKAAATFSILVTQTILPSWRIQEEESNCNLL